MTRFAICLALSLSIPVVVTSPARAARAAEKKASGKPAPSASVKELEKLKGDFKWGMSPADVIAKVEDNVRSTYDERLKKTANDPTKQDRVRKEMAVEVEKVKDKVIKFDGQKTGYDVSIVDQEFLHNNGESMLITKEPTATRYFFFTADRLSKMFLAFDKEILQGKSFREFGQLMQSRFGKAREVTVEEKSKAGVKVKLDHFVWAAKGGDMLRLVDRSEFYDVYCLVIFDGAVAEKQAQLRKALAGGVRRDNLVEAVTTQPSNDRDPHDNVLDQITGKEVLKPGESRAKDIVVPSQTPGVKAPTPADVNRKDSGGNKTAEKPEPKGTEGDRQDKEKSKLAPPKVDETKGLNL